MDLSFKGRAKRLDDIDLPRIGQMIGVGEDELHAFMEVEASGAPFDKQGRPKMLFEPHLFYALLGKGAKRDRAVKEGLAYAKWKRGSYPTDSYPRLLKAMAIDETKALMACSWGGSQILAKWFADCGYTNPQEMVTAFMDDAENHLTATVRLIVKWGIDDDLRRLAELTRPTKASDCAQIAETWNGEGYATHNYHGRIATAHNKWRKIKDTPFDPAKDGAGPVQPAPKEVFTTKAMIELVQEKLWNLGYTEVGSRDETTGRFDGVKGKLTDTAIMAFRQENGLPVSAEIDGALLKKLDEAPKRKLAGAREEATPADVREQVPEAKTSWLNKIIGQVLGIPSAIIAIGGAALDQVGAAKGVLDPIKEFAGEIPGWVWFGAVAAVAVVIVVNARKGEAKSIEAFQSGARR